jgi:hypothetical protein
VAEATQVAEPVMSLGMSAAAHDAATTSEPPRVSLVIPVRDEERSLPELLDRINRQTHPPAEIIIVNGGSVDGTLDLARKMTAGDARFCVLDAGEGTPGRNRNVGAEAAQHQWVAFLDAGTRPEPAWLEHLVEAARTYGAEVVYGNYEPVQDSFFTHCAALAYPAPKVDRAGGQMRGPSAASMMLQHEVWQTSSSSSASMTEGSRSRGRRARPSGGICNRRLLSPSASSCSIRCKTSGRADNGIGTTAWPGSMRSWCC